MDDNNYRRLCAQPDVMRRGDIRATITRLATDQSQVAARLTAILSSPPVPKPAADDGGPDTDFLRLDLAAEDIETIVEALGKLEAILASSDAPSAILSSAADLLGQ